jgi:hypothetical protein
MRDVTLAYTNVRRAFEVLAAHWHECKGMDAVPYMRGYTKMREILKN